MTHANPEFSIIIVTHNSNYYLVECMKALTTQRNKNFEIIIVDNNSNEDLINFDNFNSLEIKIIHSDGLSDIISCNHTYNDTQIKWFRAGSALNLIRSKQ